MPEDVKLPVLSHNVLDGPWQVVIIPPRWLDSGKWYIYNTETSAYKTIGKVGIRRGNNRVRAEERAKELNAALDTR